MWTFHRPRWYSVLPVAVWEGAVFVQLLNWIGLRHYGVVWLEGFLIVEGLSVAAQGAAWLWLAFVRPVLAAGDPKASTGKTPKPYLAYLRTMVWTLPGAFLLITSLVAIATFIVKPRHGASFLWFIASFIGAALLFSAVAWPVDRMVQRRFLERMKGEHLCWHCGYDVRATSSDACPECGKPFAAPP